MTPQKSIKGKNWVDKLIELSDILSYHDLADILLVWSKFKPAALVEFSHLNARKLSKQNFLKRVNELRKILRVLGLRFRLHINYPKSSKEYTRFSLIARESKTLRKLISAEREKDPNKRRLLTGTLMGYPETAVKAFLSNESIERSSLPKIVKRNPEFRFINFCLSKQWRTELGYIRKKMLEIKKISTALYKKILK